MALFYIYSAVLDRFHNGHTTLSIEERLRRHLAVHAGWTSRAKDWKVVYHESLSDKASAFRRERQVKAWKSAERIKEMIAGAAEDPVA